MNDVEVKQPGGGPTGQANSFYGGIDRLATVMLSAENAAKANKKYLERVKELGSKRSKGRLVDFKDMTPSN